MSTLHKVLGSFEPFTERPNIIEHTMFNGLLKSKFYTKCKSATKLTKTRIEIIKRKRNAMQKYLKNDIADLLKNDLDINAYCRAEGLLVELNLTACYEFAERFCEIILNNLGVMGKQRECPEECREAVSSLMFAAARFADLPELRDLRGIFTARYGNSLDCFANKEFVQMLKAIHPTKDMKLQLMQDIATEAGLDWNRKATEEKLYRPYAFNQGKNTAIDEFQTDENTADIHMIPNDGAKYREGTYPEMVRDDVSLEDDNPSTYLTQYSEERPPLKDIAVDNSGRKFQETEPETKGHFAEEELDDKKSFYYKFVPPPYTKSKIGKARYKDEGQENAVMDDLDKDSKLKLKSIRKRRGKPAYADDDAGISGGDEHGSTVSSAPHDTEHKKDQSIKQDLDLEDEEERMLDKLLMYYSRKKSFFGKAKTGPVHKPQPKEDSVRSGKVLRRGSWDVTPKRAPSPPGGQASSFETNRGHARSSSLQPETLKAPAHPKLPDYDDFLARLATLRDGK